MSIHLICHSNKLFLLSLPNHFGVVVVVVVVGMGAGGVTSVVDLLFLHMDLLCIIVLL